MWNSDYFDSFAYPLQRCGVAPVSSVQYTYNPNSPYIGCHTVAWDSMTLKQSCANRSHGDLSIEVH